MTLKSTVATCLLILTCVGCRNASDANTIPPAAFHNDPLTIAADYRPGLMPGYHISINSSGSAEVTTGLHLASPTRVPARLSNATVDQLRMALKRDDFFSLPSTIGSPAVDGTEVTLTVVLGPHAHTVVVHRGSIGPRVEEGDRFFRVYRDIVSSVRDQLEDPKVNEFIGLFDATEPAGAASSEGEAEATGPGGSGEESR